MFQKNEENAADLERLIAAADGLERGQVLEHSVIAEALGYSREYTRYYDIVHRWQKHMQSVHGIATIEEPGVGWYLCTKKDQVERYERKRSRKASRQLQKAKTALEVLDDADLSVALRNLKHAKLAVIADARRTLRKKQELREAFNRPQQRQPIRELPGLRDEQPQPAA